jgi:ferredoxin
MAAHAGDVAHKSRTFHCAVCRAQVRVEQGSVIPPCPAGHTVYTRRMQEDRGRP